MRPTEAAPAAIMPVVWARAAAWPALIVEPMLSKSVAAAASISGVAITDDTPHLPPTMTTWHARPPATHPAGVERIAILGQHPML
jgi:hypothetical protein